MTVAVTLPQTHVASGVANGATVAPTTTSAVFVVIPEMTIAITLTVGTAARVTMGSTFNVQNGDDFDVAIFADGVEVTGTRRNRSFFGGSLLVGPIFTPANNTGDAGNLEALVTGLAAGSHTFDARWKRNAGTARAVGTERSIIAVEVP